MNYYALKLPFEYKTHYEHNFVEFDYINPHDFAKIQSNAKVKIIGAIKLRQTNKKSIDTVIIESHGETFQYKLLDISIITKKSLKIKGYILVHKHTYVAILGIRYPFRL